MSVSRLLDISLPWTSNFRSTSHSSASRSVSRTPENEKENPRTGEKNHARPKSQPKHRSPYPHVDGHHGRKFSTVQGSPLVNNTKKLGPALPSPAENMTDNTSCCIFSECRYPFVRALITSKSGPHSTPHERG
ncbi:hypothetical protein K503DRAFT_466676 [Rhizopogon vinicolor AM-OR11-026]|uniref:Uncharacterized protein n=1 Tax=Rhizopogon vinicolor AM-OR11-026 TaxID=1314800 RepID=A0A1B7N9Y6_9AGAM|nr:hypothetical protein K503DRAFT_466676 [Rhizopogon vinicolor AM-OR11-026]